MEKGSQSEQQKPESREERLSRLYNYEVKIPEAIKAAIDEEVKKDLQGTFSNPADLTPGPNATEEERLANAELLEGMVRDIRTDNYRIVRWLAQHGQPGRQYLYPLYGYDNVLRQAAPNDTLTHMQMVPKEKDKEGKEKSHLLDYLDKNAAKTEKSLLELPNGSLDGVFVLDESADHIKAHLEDYVRLLKQAGLMFLSTSAMDGDSQKRLEFFTQDERFQVVQLPKEFTEENSADALYYLIRIK